MKRTIAAICVMAFAIALANSQPKTIAPKEASDLLARGKDITLLDVRTAEEFLQERIPGAVLLPYDEINAKTSAKAIGETKKTVIVYCRSGRRSAIAAASLFALGYENVLDLGGIQSWPFEKIRGEPKKP